MQKLKNGLLIAKKEKQAQSRFKIHVQELNFAVSSADYSD